MKGHILTNETLEGLSTHLRLTEKSAATREKYLRDVTAFMAYCEDRQITKELVIAYKQRLIDRGYAVRSINSVLASLNHLFASLGWHECRVKTVRYQQQTYRPEEKELTRAEYTRLCAVAQQKQNKRLSLILQTICGTGIRVSELRFITVEAVRRGQATVSCKAKTRSVFIVKALQKKLLRYTAEQGIHTGCIFITRSGKPICRTNIWREMKSLCAQAKVNPSKVFPHNLRHLFARTFYAIEKDIAKRQKVKQVQHQRRLQKEISNQDIYEV